MNQLLTPGHSASSESNARRSGKERAGPLERPATLKVLDLFSGQGGFTIGLDRAGFQTIAFCEKSPFARRVLSRHWPQIPIFNDVTTLRAEDVGRVDLICGGFPCQDASIANIGGLGAHGERTGLFREILRLARDLGLPELLLENVPELLNRGFGDVLGALAALGYDVEWDCISASSLGAPHKRERLLIHAYAGGEGRPRSILNDSIFVRAFSTFSEHGDNAFDEWAALERSEPVLRGRDGLSVSMERRRLSLCGNAVVPQIPEILGRAILETAAIFERPAP